MTEPKRDPQTYEIIGAAMEVHRVVGKGLLEAVYHDSLKVELGLRGLPFESKPKIPVFYKGHELDCFYIPDFNCFTDIIAEVKAMKALTDIERAQIIHYLKLTGKPKGLLLNFGASSLEVERFVN